MRLWCRNQELQQLVSHTLAETDPAEFLYIHNWYALLATFLLVMPH